MTPDSSPLITHLRLAFAALDSRLRLAVDQARALGHDPQDNFRGLYVSDADADAYLNASADNTPPGVENEAALRARTAKLTAQAHAYADEHQVPLARLATLFELDPFAREVLILALAPEIELNYERLYAYLQDDVTKKRPTVDLVLDLLGTTLADRLTLRQAFLPEAPLLRWELIELYEDPGTRRAALPGRYIKLADRISAYLLGHTALDPRLLDACSAPDTRLPTHATYPESLHTRLQEWATALKTPALSAQPPLLLFHGLYGAGRRAAAQALATTWGKQAFFVDLAKLLLSDLRMLEAVRLAEREARLRDAVLVWLNFDALLEERVEQADREAFFTALTTSGPTILISLTPWAPGISLRGRALWTLEFEPLALTERRALWHTQLDHQLSALPEHDLNALASQFRLTGGQIRDAAAAAHARAQARDPHNPQIAMEDLYAGSRAQAQVRLTGLAQKIEPRYQWSDIVLPPFQLGLLSALVSAIRYRAVVQSDWGFVRQFGAGKGLVALFSGVPGTGKTMSAEIIAHELHLDLFKIDLSSVVSKYIGETEKNLSRIFSEAQAGNAILFFDEADALFGKRSEVRDAHDRYANIETAYLLQQTESYDGLVILATNLKKNMDEAFMRRMHFVIDFPFPEEIDRFAIWSRMFPPSAPQGTDLDLRFLAKQFKLAGGNIRNIVMIAAYLAAEQTSPISMRHLVRGTAMELQKVGKLIHESDFGQYYDFVAVKS